MKKNLAKLLVLVLLVTLMVPMAANAASTYNATLTVSGPDGNGDPQSVSTTSSYQPDSAPLSQLLTAFGDLEAKTETTFANTGLRAQLQAFLNGTDYTGVSYTPSAVQALIEGDRTDTIAALIEAAGGTTITATWGDYTLTLTFTPYTVPYTPPEEPAPSEEPAADAEVTAEDIAEAGDEPIELDMDEVEPAANAAEAEAKTIDIPEDAENVKVKIPVKNVTSNTIVKLVKPDGTEVILPKAAVTEDGIVIALDEDAVIKVVEAAPAAYSDIAALSAAQKDAINFVSARGIFEGYPDGTFKPDESLNRYMFATILYRLESEPSTTASIAFEDVPAGDWFSNAVAWAADKGIVIGYSAEEFGGEDPVTREQIALMMWRYCGKPAATVTDTGAHDWAADGMSWAVANELFASGVDAQGAASRADVAVVLQNFINFLQGANMAAE